MHGVLERRLLDAPHYRRCAKQSPAFSLRPGPKEGRRTRWSAVCSKQPLRVEVERIPSEVLVAGPTAIEPAPPAQPYANEDLVTSAAGDVDDSTEIADRAGIVMPPHQQPGVEPDVSGLTLQELCANDEVYNVELSWLAFNWRVLSMALSEDTPLYERLRFLAITSSNLDEFFSKRVGGLMRQAAAGARNLKGPVQKWLPEKQLDFIAKEVRAMVAAQSKALHDSVLPELRQHGIYILTYDELSPSGAERLNSYFERELELLLTPIKLDPGHPFPFLASGSLNLAIILEDPQASSGTNISYAIVNIPAAFSRWYEVPQSAAKDGDSWQQAYMPVEQLIEHNLDQLFGGATIRGVHIFRVRRNADLERHEDEAEDLLDMISDELRERRFAPFVRLEVEANMPEELQQLLTMELNLDGAHNVLQIDRLLDLADLAQLPVDVRRLDKRLTFPSWKPQEHPRLTMPYMQKRLRKRRRWFGSKWKGMRSIFSIIRDGDVLVQHPYHSFGSSTQRFVEEAASDPHVAAIKATLYRTSSDSPIITALLKAAEHGKQVTVLVELKARFDEARNVGYAQRLENAGCNVAYGLVGFKTHCKLVLVVRREKDALHGLRSYVHIGTGNYNPSTAGLYTDLGLLSCDPERCQDTNDLFKHLTGLHDQSAVGGFRQLLVANEFMRSQFAHLIDMEISASARGKPAAVCIKVNGLDDKLLTHKLLDAVGAGVRVDAIVRGVCRLRAGAGDRFRNLRVVSVVGRFLEHHRIYCFHNGGAPLYFIGSADWMNRNLMKRVEVAVPITQPALQAQLRDILALCLFDKVDAWDMQPDGRYRKPALRCDEAPLSAPLISADADYIRHIKVLAETSGTHSASMHLTEKESARIKKANDKKRLKHLQSVDGDEPHS